MGMVEGTNFRGENIQSGLGGITSVSDDKTQPDKKITDRSSRPAGGGRTANITYDFAKTTRHNYVGRVLEAARLFYGHES
jgi:hypothetical protein